jgi:hypothetical protein
MPGSQHRRLHVRNRMVVEFGRGMEVGRAQRRQGGENQQQQK